MEMARRFSAWSWNTLFRIERVPGMMKAAPTPVTARHTSSCHVAVATLAASDATKNKIRPPCKANLRPNRSASAPAGSRRAANTRL
jgi:hypothetical protein